MRTKVLSAWESIRTSLWFVPTTMLVAAVGLSLGMTWLSAPSSLLTGWLGALRFPAGAEGARLLLSTIAGSTITVVGVAFSITIAAVTLTSSQFGPRLLRSFMADKGNQVVLGTYIGTFIQIRQSAEHNAAVNMRLLEALQAIAVTTRTEAQRQVIRGHVEMIYRGGHEGLTEKKDRDDLEERFRAVMEKLGAQV